MAPLVDAVCAAENFVATSLRRQLRDSVFTVMSKHAGQNDAKAHDIFSAYAGTILSILVVDFTEVIGADTMETVADKCVNFGLHFGAIAHADLNKKVAAQEAEKVLAKMRENGAQP